LVQHKKINRAVPIETIAVSNLQNGQYIIQLYENNKLFTKSKFVIFN
jgi:hypothetical protein